MIDNDTYKIKYKVYNISLIYNIYIYIYIYISAVKRFIIINRIQNKILFT